MQANDVVIQAPMSYTGSAKRLWRPVKHSSGLAKLAIGSFMFLVVLAAWSAVTVWYLFAFWLMIPYRMIRRGQRRQRRDTLRQQEMLQQIQS